MSRVRAAGGSRVSASMQTSAENGGEGVNHAVLCSGHHRKAQRFVATTNKNAGRAFYTCPKGRDDPDRCKYFAWEDELQKKEAPAEASTSKAAQLVAAVNQGGRRLGSAADATPTSNRLGSSTGMITPQTASRPVTAEEDPDDISWDLVDTDTLEAEAIASTPSTSQKPVESVELPRIRSEASESFTDRLRSVQDSGAKRKRELEVDVPATPTRSLTDNPFLSTMSPRQPHNAMTDTLTSLEKLSNELHRRDRLLNAAEAAKQSLRRHIDALQKRNTDLEARVAELELALRRR